jgi:hypothetical protein
MLYLKLYEAFNGEDFYQEIGIDEYDEKTSKDKQDPKDFDKEFDMMLKESVIKFEDFIK